MKSYTIQRNIGKARHVVSHHDGVKRHADGSKFFNVSIFPNIQKRDGFVKILQREGYVEGR